MTHCLFTSLPDGQDVYLKKKNYQPLCHTVPVIADENETKTANCFFF